MKDRSVFILSILLFILGIHNNLQSQVLTWEFTQTTRNKLGQEKTEPITYFISPDVTKIEYTNEIIYIDYYNHILYRYNKADEVCMRFSLTSNNVNEPSDTQKISEKGDISLIGSLKVITTTERKKVAHCSCSLKYVMFGADLAKFQMVYPRVRHEYGQKFTEAMVGYYVCNDINGLNTLYTIAQRNSDVFKNNPLLRQVDIVGLFEILSGFPVQIRQELNNCILVATLREAPKQIHGMGPFQSPDGCRASQ